MVQLYLSLKPLCNQLKMEDLCVLHVLIQKLHVALTSQNVTITMEPQELKFIILTRYICPYIKNALRIVLNTINSAANRHCKYIEPLVSFQTDFYLRVFVIVRRGKKECAESGIKVGNSYNCNSCGNYEYYSHFVEKKNHKGLYVPNKVGLSSPLCKVCEEPYFLSTACFNVRWTNLAC